MYQQIEGFLSAEEAADEMVRYANIISKSIKNGDTCFFGIQRVGLNALLDLLAKYSSQEQVDRAK